MLTDPPHCDSSEEEFLAALRKRRARHLAAQATPDERKEWDQWASQPRVRGLLRSRQLSRVFALTEKMIRRGVDPKQALRRATNEVGLRFPANYAADPNAWLRRLEQSYRDRPQHHHALLDPDRAYGVEHAVYAVICRLPEIAAAIFITSDSAMRKRIIQALF